MAWTTITWDMTPGMKIFGGFFHITSKPQTNFVDESVFFIYGWIIRFSKD